MFSATIFLVVLVIAIRDVSAFSWPSFLDPVKGSTDQGEMQCYSLPYGGLGFASHIITYYTLAVIWLGKRPLMPWKKMHWVKFDCMLGIVTLILSVGLATFTIVRCRNRWQFMLIAIWKIFMSAMLGFSTITASLSVRHPGTRVIDRADAELHPDRVALMQPSAIEMTGPSTAPSNSPQKEEASNASALWLLLYLPGLITGLVGLFSLVKDNWDNHTIRLITYILWGIPTGLSLCLACCVFFSVDDGKTAVGSFTFIGSVLVAIGILGALYSDWILGAIAGNYSGLPASDNAVLYWGYFLAKKIPLGSL